MVQISTSRHDATPASDSEFSCLCFPSNFTASTSATHHIAHLYTSSLPDCAGAISMDADVQISGMIIGQLFLRLRIQVLTVPPFAFSDLALGNR